MAAERDPHGHGLAGMTCLVLGGGGFIGTNLCRALLRQGATVRGFGRRRAYPQAIEDVAWFAGDFADRTRLARAVEGSELVFHLLGGSLPAGSSTDPAGDIVASVLPTLQLFDLCRAGAVRKLVFVSSGGTVYGIPQSVPIPETAPNEPISAYGISRLAIEKYLGLYRHLHGCNHAILRLANPYGPYQGPDRGQGLVAALMHRIASGQPVEIWGDGQVTRDFVYIDDATDALLAAGLYEGPYRVFNVGSGIGRSVRQVVDAIAATLGRPDIALIHKPGRATDVPINVLDISLIEREMGWSPRVGWTDGLARTAAWTRDSLGKQG